ncbi:hypothetical protein VTI28DRAFT_8346 [Corynascus sepedonium]
MSSKSSYIPRFGISRGDGPILPLHNRRSPSIRKKPSEYDLSDLSPRSDDGFLSSLPENDRGNTHSLRENSTPSSRHSDRATDRASSKTKLKPPPLFAGPPPPIATSQVLYRDEEDRDTSASSRYLGTSSFAHNINSVLFDRNSSSPNRTQTRDYNIKPDAIWLNIQRRERALQKELQHLLDAQSSGLAANLDPDGGAPSVSSAPSEADTRSLTPTTTSSAHSPGSSRRSRQRHVTFQDYHHSATLGSASVTSSGTLVPVRQPRAKPVGLRAARAGLARSIALLADLKTEEDAQLAAALSARKQALAQLRRWTARREGIAEELRLFEEADERDEGAPGRELRELEGEREEVSGEIAELEERLAALRNRRTWLDGRIEEVRSRREAGLSGYRGALREVDGKIVGLLTRPGVKPLDGNFFSSSAGSDDGSGVGIGESPGGVEFLRLRPERRTAEMAREWWEKEVAMLERRKREVDKERTALEQGVEVWREAVRLVSEFEAELRSQIQDSGKAETNSKGKGKNKEGEPASPPPPEQLMYAQLGRMRVVMAGLEERLHVTEENGWNLLICAIGAELEAFRQAENMLQEALRAAGFDVEHDDGEQGDSSTPHLGRSTGLGNSSQRLDKAEPGGGGKLVGLHDGPGDDRESESDNEVPPDLLVSAQEEHEPESPSLSREDSNDVPAEFLREHSTDGDFPHFGTTT